MRLTRYQVTGFRSVRESDWIETDAVTALIGVNESGKTNLLVPLWKLKPAKDGEIAPLADLPRSQYTELRDTSDQRVFVRADFEPDPDLVDTLVKETGLTAEHFAVVQVARMFGGGFEVRFPEAKPPRTLRNTQVLTELDAARDEIKSGTGERARRAAMLVELENGRAAAGAEMLDAPAIVLVRQALSELKNEGAAVSPLTARWSALVSKLEEMETSLGATHPDGVEAAAGAVTKRLPAFVYYSMSDTRPKIMLSGKKVAPAPVVARKAIADLVPYEGAVVGSKVDALRAALQAGTAVPPPKVMQIGTDFLVQDGNHRVCAAKLEGRADMDVEVVAKDQRFADALRHALRRGRKGFEAMTTVADDAARIAFTNAEEEDDGTFDLAASLQAKLGTEPSSGE